MREVRRWWIRWRDCVGGNGFEVRVDLYYMSCCVRCMLSGCTNRCDFYLQFVMFWLVYGVLCFDFLFGPTSREISLYIATRS